MRRAAGRREQADLFYCFHAPFPQARDSVQSIHQILRMLETLEERISAVERASEAHREADHYRIAA